jgi:hypothetical protein
MRFFHVITELMRIIITLLAYSSIAYSQIGDSRFVFVKKYGLPQQTEGEVYEFEGAFIYPDFTDDHSGEAVCETLTVYLPARDNFFSKIKIAEGTLSQNLKGGPWKLTSSNDLGEPIGVSAEWKSQDGRFEAHLYRNDNLSIYDTTSPAAIKKLRANQAREEKTEKLLKDNKKYGPWMITGLTIFISALITRMIIRKRRGDEKWWD